MNEFRSLFVAVFLTVFSYFCVAATSAIVKAIDHRLDISQILLCQSAFGAILIGWLAWGAKKRVSFLRSHHYGWLWVRALAGLAAYYFIYVSLNEVSVADATLLMNAAPLFIPFLLLIFFRESVRPIIWLGILPGFVGIVLILQPGSELFQPLAILPLISGLAVALIFIALRQLHAHRESMLKILLYLYGISTLIMLPIGMGNWKTPNARDGLLLFLSALTGFLGQTTITVALKYASPKTLAPLCYTSVAFGLMFDWLFWHHVPTMISFFGMILVVVGGVIAIFIRNHSSLRTGGGGR